MKNRILNIGPVTKDHIITPTNEYYQIGGAVFYQMKTLLQLKNSVDSIITIGKNDLEMISEYKNMTRIVTKTTTQYTNIYDKNNNRTQKAILPKNPITKKDIKLEKKYQTALISPLSPYDTTPETIKYLKENDIETVLVAQGYLRKTDAENNIIKNEWNDKEKYLKYTDIISMDENEYKTAFNQDKIDDKIINKIINKYDLKNMIITQAEKGSTIYTKEKKYMIPAIKTDNLIDSTGLGDTYIAAYVSKKQKTNSVYEAGLFASICAKEKIQNKGPLKTEKTKIEKELVEILDKNR